MSTTRWWLLTALIPLSFPTASRAAPSTPGTTHLSVASDLAPWALDGFSGIVALEPAGLPRWRMTAELWGMRLPGFVVERVGDNAAHGFRHRVDVALALYADRALAETGFHLGGVVSVMQARVDRGGPEEQRFGTADALVRAGWRWLPLGPRGPFLNPWLAAGLQLPLGDLPVVSGQRYALSPMQLLATVHAGWRF